MAQTHTAALAVDCRCLLGEGLVWDSRRRVWLWTDIESSVIWQHRPADGTTRRWHTPDRVGSFAVCASGRLLLGLANRVVLVTLDQTADRLEGRTLTTVEADQPSTRVNDGRPDRHGRFVFGTYNEHGDAPLGHFYQFSFDHGLRRLDLDGVAVANSVSFSPDGRTLFFCDSATRRIMRANYDSAHARVSDVSLFVELPADGPLPDGSTIDADGGLWNAEWNGRAVRRYDQDGRTTDTVDLPESNITCPTFGGDTLETLGITSARSWVEPAALETYPQTGGFYVASPGRRGLADTPLADTTV